MSAPYECNLDPHGDDALMLAIVKGEERYVFVYSDSAEHRAELLRLFGRYASNPLLSFTWYDAAVASQKVREQASRTPRIRIAH